MSLKELREHRLPIKMLPALIDLFDLRNMASGMLLCRSDGLR